MHAPIHIASGLVVGRLFKWKQYRFFAVLFTLLLTLFFHAVLDAFAKFPASYPAFSFTEPLWLMVNVISILGSLVLLYIYWTEYAVAILFSLLPDVEYFVLLIVDAFGKEITYYKKPWIHIGMSTLLDAIPPFTLLHEMPPYLNYGFATLVELCVLLVLLFFFNMLVKRRRNVNFG